MLSEREFENEYKVITPRLQPYAKLPCTREAEKLWWREYYKRNPTLLMRLGKRFSKNSERIC